MRGTLGPAIVAGPPLYPLHVGIGSPVSSRRREAGEGRHGPPHEAQSSRERSAPSTGAQGSDGIERPSPRMHKGEQGHRLRGSRRHPPARSTEMRYVGIDIGSEVHVVAIVDASEAVLQVPTRCTEDAAG